MGEIISAAAFYAFLGFCQCFERGALIILERVCAVEGAGGVNDCLVSEIWH